MQTDIRPQTPLDSPRVCGVPDQSAPAGAIEQQVGMMSLEWIGFSAKETRYGNWQKKWRSVDSIWSADSVGGDGFVHVVDSIRRNALASGFRPRTPGKQPGANAQRLMI
jgi:hypothetical protein